MNCHDPLIKIAPAKPFDQGAPRINGPAVYGASPKCDFLYYVPVRGERPVRWSVEGTLPPGLTLDQDRGIITGQAEAEGVWQVTLKAANRLGEDAKKFRIEIAPCHLSRTPLLGWTSWNAHSVYLTEDHIYTAASLLCKTGLRDFGYAYVNTDSCWQGQRESTAAPLQPNKYFSNMRAMTDYIHGLGLKAGIYSTPMVHAWGSCASRPALLGSTGYPLNPDAFHPFFGGCGKTHFEKQDALQWAQWGFDYLKYDWPVCDAYYTRCMSEALRATGRDFVYSLTTGCMLENIPTYRECSNMVRGNRDTIDSWEDAIKPILFPDDEWLKFSGPGHWYDMDMLALGDISGISRSIGNRLTRNEQITHMAVWAFMASPIQLSCNLADLDDFTMALFTNEELLDINQDELGDSPVREITDGNSRIYTRKMANGDIAAAFINAEDEDRDMKLSRPGSTLTVRDVLAGEDMGDLNDEIRVTVPAHGTRVFRFAIR